MGLNWDITKTEAESGSETVWLNGTINEMIKSRTGDQTDSELCSSSGQAIMLTGSVFR